MVARPARQCILQRLLWPVTLRAIVGHSYVFQVVMSEQPFRTGQLCFQARRLFNPPSVHESVPANVTPGNGPSDAITESAIPGESTPQELKQIFLSFHNSPERRNVYNTFFILFLFSFSFLFPTLSAR